MKRLQIAFAIASLSAACGQKAAPGTPGKLHLHSGATADTATGSTPICAHFTLQPFAPASDGSPINAGAALQLDSSAASNATDLIAGCIDGPNDTAGYNWGYIVTVDTFSQCGTTPGTLGAPFTNVYPATETFIVPVHCQAGLDTTVPVTAEVSISEANQGGYVDITTTVDATTEQTGCKLADIGFTTDHQLHFGESNIAADGSTGTGLVALDTGAPTQFGGTVDAPAGGLDTYYTGYLPPHAASAIYQTFVHPCSIAGQEYAAPRHAQCVSDNSGSPGGTSANLADAFIELSGHGFAAASVVNGGLQIYSSSTDATMTAGPGFTPAYNALVTTNIDATDPSLNLFTVTGVFVDQGAPMQFLVSATAGDGTPVYAILSASGTLGNFFPVDGQVISCHGLYHAPASCFSPVDCTAGAGARTGVIIWNPPLATYWLYAFWGGGPATLRPSIFLSNAGEPNLSLDPLLGFPTYGIRFANKLSWGTPYNISVASAPANVTCVLQRPTGTIYNNTFLPTIYCGPKSWKEAAAGIVMGDGIATDGTLWAWGNNYYNTLGLGQTSYSPLQVGTDSDWKHLADGGEFTVAIKNDGTIWAWGQNFSYGLGDGTTNLLTVPTKIGTDTDWTQVAASWNTIVALKANGTLWRWGIDYSNNAGVLTPTQVGTANDWQSVKSGMFDVVLFKTNNTVWPWGQNYPTALPQQLGTANDWATGAAGDGNLFLIKTSGTLWSVGYNADGELGNGTTTDTTALAQVGTATDWAQVAASAENTGGVRTNGDLYAWGANASGQIGNGTTVASSTPVLVGSGYAAYISGSWDLSFGLKTNQSLWAWGSDGSYNLGIGGYPMVLSPTLVP